MRAILINGWRKEADDAIHFALSFYSFLTFPVPHFSENPFVVMLISCVLRIQFHALTFGVGLR